MPDTWTPTRPVSEEDAHTVLLKLRQWLYRVTGQSAALVMHEPGTGWGDHWVIGWEGAPIHPWTVLATTGGIDDYSESRVKPIDRDQLPAGVFCEPINSCELGIYPA